MNQTKILIVSSILFLLLAISCAGNTATETASIVIGGKPVICSTLPLIRNQTVLIPSNTLSMLKATTAMTGKRRGDEQRVDITRWDGKKVSCKAVYVDDNLMIPLSDISSELGTTVEWLENERIVNIKAQVEKVAFDGSQLEVSTSYPVRYKVNWWKDKNRLIVQIFGAVFPSRDSDLTISNATSAGIRLGSDNDAARVVIDMPNEIKYKVVSASSSAIINASISGFAPVAQAPVYASPEPVNTDTSQGAEISAPPAETVQPSPAVIKDIDCDIDGKQGVIVTITADSPVKYLSYMFRQPDKLVIDFKNATFDNGIKDKQINHEILKSIEVENRFQNTARISMDLSRVISYRITPDISQSKLQISLDMPKGAGGLLADKVVVIDPGHGGPSKTGTKSCDGTREKDLTLAIAKKIQEVLKDSGVCVLLTRDSDIELNRDLATDLKMRPEFAARNSADFFISIHCNALSTPKKISGTETFYHGADVNGRALAECIHPELLKVTNLPDRKIKSDYSMYSGGFAVLRGSSERYNIPAILIETGFIDNPCDSSIISNPVYQQKIAEAVAKGLKTYVEGNQGDMSATKRKNNKTKEVGIRQKSVTVSKAETLDIGKLVNDKVMQGPKRPGEIK